VIAESFAKDVFWVRAHSLIISIPEFFDDALG